MTEEYMQPTEEFRVPVSDERTAALKEMKNDATAFYRMSETEDGKRILAYLERFTNRPVGLETLPHGAVHKEGQLWLIHEIRTQIAQGAKLHGS